MCSIHFGTGTDSLTLRVHGRVKPNTQDYWDANWLHCSADVSAGPFRGTLDWQLRNEDLARFMHALEGIAGRTGEAQLETLDGWLDVRIIRDEQGHIEARCQLVDNPAGGNSLDFRLLLDQPALVALIRQLSEVVELFPFVGVQSSAPRKVSDSY